MQRTPLFSSFALVVELLSEGQDFVTRSYGDESM